MKMWKTRTKGPFVEGIDQKQFDKLLAIVNAAWEVRREEPDYNSCPDLSLRALNRKELYKLLDEWKNDTI